MRNVRIFFTLSSALIVAASVYGVSADARKSDFDQCTANGLSNAECACELALEKGTQKALRDYLKLYRNADTACNAQASTVITENSNGGESNPGGSNPGGSSSNGGSSNGGSSNGGSSNGGSSNGGGSKGANNGHGNGDQDAPGNSLDHNNAENSEHSEQGNSGNNGARGNNN